MTPLDAERAVIGALLTGALRHADLANAPDGLGSHLRHRRIIGLLRALLEVRIERGGHRKAPGIDWRFADRACNAARVWPIAVVSVDPPALCGLLDLARAAPRRGPARQALDIVIQDARRRADAFGERARLRDAVAELTRDLVGDYLGTALEEAAQGGYAAVRFGRGREAWVCADVIRGELARVKETVATDES